MRFSSPLLAALALIPGALAATPTDAFEAYWNQGKGEITRYALTQSRYGERHEGDAVLIFVTEPFSRSKQVKLDDWARAGADRVDVLKLNFTKKFLTGIYPYSLMLSVFTPIDAKDSPRTLKTTMSGQEWCGQAFTQLNLQPNGRYRLRAFSYFESDGDEDRSLPAAFLEDELWTRVRLAPEALPTGDFPVLPGSLASRLLHQPLAVRPANGGFVEPDAAVLAKRFGPQAPRAYRLAYSDGDRRALTIYFDREFPHGIAGWDEVWTSPRGGEPNRTEATRTATVLTPYWREHGNADRARRSELDLSTER